jgi:hypothetical protein
MSRAFNLIVPGQVMYPKDPLAGIQFPLRAALLILPLVFEVGEGEITILDESSE